MSEKTEEARVAAREAIEKPEVMNVFLENLEGSSRRNRQRAASILASAAHIDAQALAPHIGILIDALDRPEAQTRWECLEALVMMVPLDSDACDRALEGAETALFDENSGILHLASMRFLCKLGATTERRSVKVWPLLDEAIQCYHGDPEFNDMLIALIEFSAGNLDAEVKAQMKNRMAFDAENGKGVLGSRACQIVGNLG